MNNEYTVGSLFSGVGGIEIGFEKQGFKTEWFIENEPYAKAVLKKRFPGTKIYDDVTEVDFRTVPKVDILTGGFPCQDISHAGKGVGIEGSRSSLWKYYHKAIRILRPKFALIENVSALAIRGLNVVLADLAKIGYDAEWYNISASAVGAFHQRERIFIIAYPNCNRESDVSFNEGEGQGFMDEGSNSNKSAKPQETRFNGQFCEQEGGEMGTLNRTICEAISNTNDERPEGKGQDEIRFTELPNTECIGPQKQGKPRGSMYSEENKDRKTSRFNDDGIWRIEPELGRVADGVPNRVDRIKCLGNAVVPQCAEVFAKAIKMELQEASP